MKISVRVKPNARKHEVRELGKNSYLVSVAAPPVAGKANEMVIEVLAEYFGKPKSCFSIVRGKTFRQKIIEVVT